MIKTSKKHNMMKDLANIVKYLEQAGFIEHAKKVRNVMAALDGQFVIDPYPIPDAQRNVENQGYIGGDGVSGGYSLLHTPMIGQPADDHSKIPRQIVSGNPDVDKLRNYILYHIQRNNGEFYKPAGVVSLKDGDLAMAYWFDEKNDAEKAHKALRQYPDYYKTFEASLPHEGIHWNQKGWLIIIKYYSEEKAQEKQEQNNTDELAVSNKNTRQQWEDDLLDIFKSFDGKEKDVYEDNGDIYSLFQFDDKLEADLAFKALNRHPAHNTYFQSTTPYRIKNMPFWYIGLREYGSTSQNNVDMLAASNGLRGNTVTDDQNAGMFQGLSDAYFYTGYGNLEGAYGPERR